MRYFSTVDRKFIGMAGLTGIRYTFRRKNIRRMHSACDDDNSNKTTTGLAFIGYLVTGTAPVFQSSS